LGGERGPFESSAIHKIIEEDRIFLPDLVFLVDDLGLNGFLISLLTRVDGVFDVNC